MSVLIAIFLTGASLADDPHTDQQLGSASSDYRAIHPSEATATKQVAPKYPKKAHKQGYRHEECTVQLFVSDQGKPDETTVTGNCPEVFHASAEKAAGKWRFEPVVGEDGEPEAVTFVLRFRFEAPD